jgi:hypothetical protein
VISKKKIFEISANQKKQLALTAMLKFKSASKTKTLVNYHLMKILAKFGCHGISNFVRKG